MLSWNYDLPNICVDEDFVGVCMSVSCALLLGGRKRYDTCTSPVNFFTMGVTRVDNSRNLKMVFVYYFSRQKDGGLVV